MLVSMSDRIAVPAPVRCTAPRAGEAHGRPAGLTRGTQFRARCPSHVPGEGPQLDAASLRSLVIRGRAGAPGCHPREAAQRDDALRRRLAAGERSYLPALDRRRVAAVRKRSPAMI